MRPARFALSTHVDEVKSWPKRHTIAGSARRLQSPTSGTCGACSRACYVRTCAHVPLLNSDVSLPPDRLRQATASLAEALRAQAEGGSYQSSRTRGQVARTRRRESRQDDGWPRTGPPRPPRRRLTRDTCSWRRGRVGLSADRTRHRRSDSSLTFGVLLAHVRCQLVANQIAFLGV
jgi:hypothetical protein